MDQYMYTAVIEGRVDDVLHNLQHLNLATYTTPNGNTLLHVTALHGGPAAEWVKVVVKSCPLLLIQPNYKGETPIHLASSEGHFEVVQQLIASAKALDQSDFGDGGGIVEDINEMLGLTSLDGDTALHKAVRYGHVDIVKLLAKEEQVRYGTTDVVGFSHSPNMVRETPLYMAAEKGMDDCVKAILRYCKPPYNGPCGRTALHAAVIVNSQGSTMELLNWNPDLVNIVDHNGWTPFHYAASLGRIKMARQLLDSNRSTAYDPTKTDENETALHIAAGRGHLDFIEFLLSEFSTFLEMVNGKGQNILHIAVGKNEQAIIKFVLQSHLLTSSLINHRDKEGNTPLHLAAASGNKFSELVRHPKAEITIYNNKYLTPLDIAYKCAIDDDSSDNLEVWKHAGAILYLRSGEIIERSDQMSTMNRAPPKEYHRSKTETAITRRQQSHMVIVGLIVTVTFTAGFTVPGGFIGTDGPNQGMAVLTRLAVFKVFVISDALAFFLSCSALFMHFAVAGHEAESEVFLAFTETSSLFTMYAILAMMIAFTTGTYAVLAHSLGLAIAATILCGCSFVICSIATYEQLRISDRSRLIIRRQVDDISGSVSDVIVNHIIKGLWKKLVKCHRMLVKCHGMLVTCNIMPDDPI